MWQLWISVFCVQLAICNVSVSAPMAPAQLTKPDAAPSQERPQPPRKVREAPQESRAKTKGQQKGGVRVEGNRIKMGRSGQEQEVNLLSGPTRVELMAVSESRLRFEGERPENAPESTLRLQVKILGKRLEEAVALGKVVIEEMIDDTGAVLVSPSDVNPQDRTRVFPARTGARVRSMGYIARNAETKAPGRMARKLTKVSGWINLVYATETEEIMIDNPLQCMGGHLEHPRLEALGIKLRVIEPGEEVNVGRDGHGLAIVQEENGKKLRKVEFFDAWLKPMYPRPRNMKSSDGQEYIYYGTAMGRVNEDMQLLLTVYPEIEEEQVRFTLENVELP